MTYVDSFPFLHLPTELRLQIYREIFINSGICRKSKNLHLINSSLQKAFILGPVASNPTYCGFTNVLNNISLLCTNNKIHDEASGVVYYGNTTELKLDVGPFNGEFDFGGRDIFLTMIKRANRGWLTEFRMKHRLKSVIYTGDFLD